MNRPGLCRTLAIIALLGVSAACQKHPGPEVQALRESVVRLRIATEQGTSLVKFSDLLLDLSAKAEIAQKSLNSDAVQHCAVAITAASDAKDVWQAEMGSDFPDSVSGQLRRLGIVKEAYDLERLETEEVASQPDYESDSPGAIEAKRGQREELQKTVVGEALSMVHKDLAAVESDLAG